MEWRILPRFNLLGEDIHGDFDGLNFAGEIFLSI